MFLPLGVVWAVIPLEVFHPGKELHRGVLGQVMGQALPVQPQAEAVLPHQCPVAVYGPQMGPEMQGDHPVSSILRSSIARQVQNDEQIFCMESNLQQTLAGRCFDGGSYLLLSPGVEKAAAARRSGGGAGGGAGGTVLATAGPDPPGVRGAGGYGRPVPGAAGAGDCTAPLEAHHGGDGGHLWPVLQGQSHPVQPGGTGPLRPAAAASAGGGVVEPQEFPLPELPAPAAELLPLLGLRLLQLPQTSAPFVW